MKWLFFLFLFLLVFSPVTASSDSITLLSVFQSSTNETLRGGTAELYLQIRPGTGSVFIDSFPLTQLDTQVATRLANEIACEFSPVDCLQFDFFYTIRSGSSLISGPSGGAAATVLTLAVLEGVPLRDGVAMTGAISSGGIITPVAGVPEKILAGQEHGSQHVLVPLLGFDDQFISGENFSRDYREDFSVPIHLVVSLDQAFYYATGRSFPLPPSSIEVPEFYLSQMEATSQELCLRTEKLFTVVSSLIQFEDSSSRFDSAESFFNRSKDPSLSSYARASLCYSANLPLRELYFDSYTQDQKVQRLQQLLEDVSLFSQTIEQQPIRSFVDLETLSIVTERLLETRGYLRDINSTNISSRQLALAVERYASAVAWSGFFNSPAPDLFINERIIQQACYREIRSVENRLNYLRSNLPPDFLTRVEDELTQTYRYQNSGDYVQCLFKASQTKALANIFFTTIGLAQDYLPQVIDAKASRVEQVIAKQDAFPILGYSYYTYALSLVEEDPSSALLFLEYALTFSDLSNYFENSSFSWRRALLQYESFITFVTGLILGIACCLPWLRKNPKKTSLASKKSLPGKKR